MILKKPEFLKMLKKALEDNHLQYTSITRRYYLIVPRFGGVTIATYFSRVNSLHERIYITPFADTGFMDKLNIELPIPSEKSKDYYRVWGKESNEWLDNPTNNLVPQKGHLELLTAKLSLFAIDNYLNIEKENHSGSNN